MPKKPIDNLNEYQITVAIAEELRLAQKHNLCTFTHNPMGEIRDSMTGAKLKRMGTRAGWPDFTIVTHEGTWLMEVKIINGRLSKTQRICLEELSRYTNNIRVVFGLDQARKFLDGIGCLYRTKPRLLVIDGDKKDPTYQSED